MKHRSVQTIVASVAVGLVLATVAAACGDDTTAERDVQEGRGPAPHLRRLRAARAAGQGLRSSSTTCPSR